MVYDKRIRKEKVSRCWIATAAIALFQDSRTEEEHEEDPIRFVASDPWIQNFMNRNNLTLRKRTNLTTLTDEVLVSRAVSYMHYLTLHKPEMNLDRTILMDETAVYFEDARTNTVDDIGARHIVVRSTGFASMRITVMLAVTASGRKLPPCLIWKRKNRGSIERLGGCYVAFQARAWVDQDLLLNWLDWYYPAVVQTPGQYIVWDSMRAHIGKKVKQRCSDRAIKMAVIPGGLTPYLQAGDVGIYKSFKDSISKLIEQWKRSDKVTYTKAGNPRAPDISLVTSWVSQAWKETPVEVVEKSIKACGFGSNSSDWHIAKHDVYGSKFRAAWELQEGVESESNVDDETQAQIESIMETLDDIVIEE
ncbi:hypothetical protein PHMEG_0004400 [Phytophthora megakarya]|uniref:DDE-1 domain-containing protein n=1 Tax=Phytophthora megakarya TaxID=4795 RepID=A0A225WTX6_9STRA|nr:hypothetical protein PHMEG_0004400 [Phytophthora megakarya]